jgi:hypothetical protein
VPTALEKNKGMCGLPDEDNRLARSQTYALFEAQ